MLLIIIHGEPGAGKTTLARKLHADLGFPVVAKDTIKEHLFDTIGVGDREWSRMLGRVVSDFQWELADGIAAFGKSLILESAFYPDVALAKLEKFISVHRSKVIELYCAIDPTLRRKRFAERDNSGDRHPGHIDTLSSQSAETDEKIAQRYRPFNVGMLVRIDTTSDATTRYPELLAMLKKA